MLPRIMKVGVGMIRFDGGEMDWILHYIRTDLFTLKIQHYNSRKPLIKLHHNDVSMFFGFLHIFSL